MTPAAVADVYRRTLPPGEVFHFRVDGIDRLGVPVVTARLVLPAGRSVEGIGYGATPDEALVGALGELTEEAAADVVVPALPRVEGSYARLAAARGPGGVADPLTLCLPAGSRYTPDTPLTWVEARRLATGAPVLVPEEFAAEASRQLRGRTGPPLVTPITNGLGAGLSRDQALAHGLLELLQRDGNVLSYRALDRGEAIDADEVADPALRDLLTRYRAAGVDVIPKVAATDFGMPNVYVVGAEPGPLADLPLRLTACGEAVHPDREKALRKALLEFAGSRARKSFRHGPFETVAAVAPPGYLDKVLPGVDPAGEEERALHRMMDWLAADDATLRGLLAARGVLAVKSRVPLSGLPTVAPGAADAPADRLRLVAGRLADAGLDVLSVDLSPPGGEVFVTKAIVPGLESETLSYHRIGERGVRRLLDRGSPLAGVGNGPAGAKRVLLPAAAEARLGGPAWFDPAAADALVGDLYPLYREPSGHAAQVKLRQLAAG